MSVPSANRPPPAPLPKKHKHSSSLYDLHQALSLPSLPSLSFSEASSSGPSTPDLVPAYGIGVGSGAGSGSGLPIGIDAYAPAPLGPFDALPPHAGHVKSWRILILVTSVNSFAQKVVAYLDHLGIHEYAVHVASSAEGMFDAARRFGPDVVICPFLTARIPESVFTRVSPKYFVDVAKAKSSRT